MTWIFGSLQMTPCALVSCHILISKQEFFGDVTFETLMNNVNEEFKEIRREQLLLKYEDNRSLTYRKKRSVLPFVGNALCYLFGFTSEEDLHGIRKALGKLANT